MNKRGISPLIAIVLVIGLTVTVLAGVFIWWKGLAGSTITEYESISDLEIKAVTGVEIAVTSLLRSGVGDFENVEALVKNNGVVAISGIVASAEYQGNTYITRYTFPTELEPLNGDKVPINYVRNGVNNVCILDTIELFPIISDFGRSTMVSSAAVRLRGTGITNCREICDGLDNDGNILIDDGYNFGSCVVGIGGCQNAGNYACSQDGDSVVCSARPSNSGDEGLDCDGLDNDCDGSVDESINCSDGNPNICTADVACGTDVGECTTGFQSCSSGVLGVCDGQGPVSESCGDGLDNDCDGLVDCNDNSCSSNEICTDVFQCVDSDGDGFGFCPNCIGCAFNGNDCNDNIATINPLASENCNNGVDDNCNGLIDCSDSSCSNNPICLGCIDNDGDEFWDRTGCGGPVDCDDDEANANPGLSEICTDAIDNDCDGFADCSDPICYTHPSCITCNDGDLDTYDMCDSSNPNDDGKPRDCNDNNPNINPGHSEICDGVDNNCDGGLGANENTHSTGNEICGDPRDNDCDGQIDEGCGGPQPCDCSLCGGQGRQPACCASECSFAGPGIA